MSKNKKKIFSLILVATLSFGFFPKAYASDNLMFVVITATKSCSTCKSFEPILEELENEYTGRIDFIKLDVSSREEIEEAKQIAENSGISKYFAENKGAVPKVGILCPGGTKVEKEFLGEIRKEVYEKTLDSLLEDPTQICSL